MRERERERQRERERKREGGRGRKEKEREGERGCKSVLPSDRQIQNNRGKLSTKQRLKLLYP